MIMTPKMLALATLGSLYQIAQTTSTKLPIQQASSGIIPSLQSLLVTLVLVALGLMYVLLWFKIVKNKKTIALFIVVVPLVFAGIYFLAPQMIGLGG